MSVYTRTAGGPWHVEVEWRGWPRLRLSSGSKRKARATAMEKTLVALKDAGRRDLLGLLADGRLSLPDLHDQYTKTPALLEQRLAQLASPALGPLVTDWLAWLELPEALSPKTRAPYSRNTIRRYRVSWESIFEAAPEGRAVTLKSLTRGFFLDLRGARFKAGASGVTVNRDFVAVAAFLRWCAEVKQIPVPAISLPREKENPGRERWLSADELAQLYLTLPPEWVPLFKTLAETGLRLGEAVSPPQKRGSGGLRWQDVRFADRTIIVRGSGVETTKGHKRRVPMPEGLARALAAHREAVSAGPQEAVFPKPFTYQAAERAFARAVGRLAWPDTVVHDLRHTFGVHAVMAGVALPRIQKIMGHKTPAMTLRYAQHAPEPHAQDDAARIAASMTGTADKEAKAVRDLLKPADSPQSSPLTA